MKPSISLAYLHACFKPKIIADDYGCWIWPGGMNAGQPNGRLSVKVFRKNNSVSVRRWVWQRAFCGLLPKFHVSPSCGNDRCVHPHHVQVVLSGQIDRSSQPKFTKPNIRNSWSTVVTPDMAEKIILLHRDGKHQGEIAKAVGCHQSTVSRFVRVEK